MDSVKILVIPLSSGGALMLPKEHERTVMDFSRVVKESITKYESISKEIQRTDQLISDILHELDHRNHIVGLPRKRKVDSREAMVLGLRLKVTVMRRRDLKDKLAFLQVVRQQVDEKPIENIRKFVEAGKNRKYMRRVNASSSAVGINGHDGI